MNNLFDNENFCLGFWITVVLIVAFLGFYPSYTRGYANENAIGAACIAAGGIPVKLEMIPSCVWSKLPAPHDSQNKN